MMATVRSGPVLVVEDDAEMCMAIRDTLESEGYETAEARDGGEALRWLDTHAAPPLVLLDWNMVPMNGGEFMTLFADHPAAARTKVVLFSADNHMREKAAGIPFSGFLAKPVNLDDLFEVVGRFCS